MIAQCVAGKKVVDICEFGDTVIVAQCAASFKSKKVEKGVAFPTCLSVNEVVCHYSPLAAESTTLAEGDIVKMYGTAPALSVHCFFVLLAWPATGSLVPPSMCRL